MAPPSNPSNPAAMLSAFYAQLLSRKDNINTNTNNKNTVSKPTPDRHHKGYGKDRRIRVPMECAEIVFKLSKALGHRNAGQTMEWLLNQANSAVEAVIGPVAPQLPPATPPPPPPRAPPVVVPPHPCPILPLPTWVPPLAPTVFPAYNEFQSAPSTGAGENAKCGSIPRPIPMPPSANLGHINLEPTDYAEISADEVAKFLFGPTPDLEI